MKVIAGKSEHEFENCPAGSHPARCYAVIDLGTQTGNFGDKHEVRIYWEVHCEETMSDGRPFMVNERFNLSLHEKANLRKTLEAWRGKPFENLEEFEMKNLIGACCLLNVVHTQKGDSTYSDVASIMPLPRAIEKPLLINEPMFVSLEAEEYSVSDFDRLTDRMKETIGKSPEWQALQKPEPVMSVEEAKQLATQPGYDDPEIPF